MGIENRSVLIIFPLMLLLTVAFGIRPAVMAASTPRIDKPASTRVNSFVDLPPGLVQELAKLLQKDLPVAYQMRKAGENFRAENPAHKMAFTFKQVGPRVESADGSCHWGMTR